MKEIIERAERLGYKKWFGINELQYTEYQYLELCLIHKWLREEKGLFLYISILIGEKAGNSFQIIIQKGVYYAVENTSLPFDQALEEGIKKALEILEKNI